ncbi:MAG: hypothetical protein LBD24_05465 [Spirochaetaceae bacterium]|jgi:hypothetical protein|nr:hypothetical protein [Spirochaetaceae bacterium]
MKRGNDYENIAAAGARLNAQTTSEGLRYEWNGQRGVTITKYTGTAATLVIPAKD